MLIVIEKTANAAIAGGSGIASGTGAAMAFGLTPNEWSVFGILAGIAVGLLGVVVKGVIDWHFKAEHLKLAQSRAAFLAGGEE